MPDSTIVRHRDVDEGATLPNLTPSEIVMIAVVLLFMIAGAGAVVTILVLLVRIARRQQQLPPNTTPPGPPTDQFREPEGYVARRDCAPSTSPTKE